MSVLEKTEIKLNPCFLAVLKKYQDNPFTRYSCCKERHLELMDQS